LAYGGGSGRIFQSGDEMMMRCVGVMFLMALMAKQAACEPANTVPASAVGSDSSVVVNSETDPKFALINAVLTSERSTRSVMR
jgi:hypothetical protein